MLEHIRYTPPDHWVLQSGLRDALPDVTEVALSQTEAVDLAGKLFGLSDLEKVRLELFGYVYQNILADGADYVELYQCRCEHIDWHYRSIERRHATRDSESRIRVSVI